MSTTLMNNFGQCCFSYCYYRIIGPVDLTVLGKKCNFVEMKLSKIIHKSCRH